MTTTSSSSSTIVEEKKSHYSVFDETVQTSSKDVTMNVNRGETNDFAAATAGVYDTAEKRVSAAVQNNENIENGSITKKSALQFFKNAIEESKQVEKQPYGGGGAAGNLNFTAATAPNRSYSLVEENVSSFKQQQQQQQFNEPAQMVLEPGPPPTFDYMPRASSAGAQQCVKKDQMTERLKRLSTNQKLLSPEQIPSGAVRIFPDVTTETRREVQQNATEDARPAAPLLRPRADIEVRPGSPRPSAEAISMEKLWSKAHSTQRVRSPQQQQQQNAYASSSESHSFVSESVERNGELVKSECREEKTGRVNIDDGVGKVSESFSEISARPAKHAEPPSRYAVDDSRPGGSANVQLVNSQVTAGGDCTQRFTDESSRAITTPSRFLPEPQQRGPPVTTGPVKHVQPPNNNENSNRTTTGVSQFTRSHSEETAAKQWKPQQQPPNAFKGPNDNTTYSSSFETHRRSSFTHSVETDGVLVTSEHRREVEDGGGARGTAHESFSERFNDKPTRSNNSSNKSNSIKTMQKMFEQTSGGGGGQSFAARPFSRMKFGASDSDFESEAELSKYCGNASQQQSVSESFESKTYKSQLQEIKSITTSTVQLQSPVKDSGYAADTDEPRGFQSDAAASHHHHNHHHHHHNQTTFDSKRSNNNSGFQSAFIKKVRCAGAFILFF